jgi:C4-dicarboxylate transporter DctM subunit
MFMLLVNLLLLAGGLPDDHQRGHPVLAPLLAPVAEAYGYDKVLFGIIMILNLEIGFLTPPVGLNLIVAMSAFKQPFGLLCQAALPFVVLMLARWRWSSGSRGLRWHWRVDGPGCGPALASAA